MSGKATKATLTILMLLVSLLILCACGDNGGDETTPAQTTPAQTTPAQTTAGDPEIVFSVNGVKTKVTLKAGEMPVYTGATEWQDSEHFYRLLGWDKEIAPAAGNTVYTAEVGVYGLDIIEVLWDTRDGITRTEIHTGETPVAPAVNATKEEADKIYTFTGEWSPAIGAVTEDKTLFEAQYTSVARTYDITFVSEGKTVAVNKVAYGETPVAPDVKIPEGYLYVSWGTLVTVKGEATYTAVFATFDPEVLATAVKTLDSGSASDRANAALLVALEEQKTPGLYTDYVLSYLRWIIVGGHEPSFDFSPNFFQPMASAAIAMAKSMPSVWGKLNSEEKDRLDLLMKCMAVQSAQATDDGCGYTSGPAFNGNYNKTWNPNYPLSNVTQILFCLSYFGSADAVNQILADFDYDTYIAAFKSYGWTNVLSIWTRDVNADGTISYKTATEGTLKETRTAKILTDDGKGHMTLEITVSSEDVAAQEYGKLGLGLVDGEKRTIDYTTPKAMMMEGGPIYAMKALYRISQYVGKPCGDGIGVPAIGEKGYSYKGFTLSEPEKIWNSLLNYNYSGGIVASKEVKVGDEYRCYIYDGTSTPVEGLYGMMKEFRSGQRSSVGYCRVDFIMCSASTAALDALGIYDSTSDANLILSKNIWVGNTDFLYKAEHGYVSYSGTAVRGDPKPEYGSGAAYEIWAYYWTENGGKAFALDDFVFPDLNKNVAENVTLNYAKPVTGSVDLTIGVGSPANTVKGDKNYWENDFIVSYSMYYSPDCLSGFGFRLRGTASNQRTEIMSFSAADGTFTFKSAVPADAASPTAIPIGEYGWHRITVQYHQGAEAVEATKSVAFSVTLTVYIDGVKAGTYTESVSDYTTRGWLLYGASYDETQPDHIAYSIYTPDYSPWGGGNPTWVEGSSQNNPYFQIYRGKVFNDPEQIWFFELGDMRTYCAAEPESAIAPISYELNGGAFVNDREVGSSGGYVEKFDVTNVTYYAAERLVTLAVPEKEGYLFAGWYDNAACEGERLVKISTEDSTPVTLYAAWDVDTAPAE